MKIVIDIDKETYYKVLGSNNRGFLLHAIAGILQTGTILPKGHGRLIDADALLISDEECGEIGNCLECKMYVETCEHFKATIEKAPTIIEAEKEADT